MLIKRDKKTIAEIVKNLEGSKVVGAMSVFKPLLFLLPLLVVDSVELNKEAHTECSNILVEVIPSRQRQAEQSGTRQIPTRRQWTHS